LNSNNVKKDRLKQKKLSCAKHRKRNPKRRDKVTQKMAIGRKIGGDGQECIDK
jgi:hypothetical protein